MLRQRRPWVDATLAVFERRAGKPAEGTTAEMAKVMAAGFAKMKQLTGRVAREGGRVVMGGHTEVPFAARGEAPWRELELLVDSGLTPLEAITAATSTAAGFLYRERELGTLRPGFHADLVVLRDNPAADIAAVRTVERVMVAGRWVEVAKYRATDRRSVSGPVEIPTLHNPQSSNHSRRPKPKTNLKTKSPSWRLISRLAWVLGCWEWLELGI